MLSGSEKFKPTLSVTMPFPIMSIRSLSQHWHTSWKDIIWNNFICTELKYFPLFFYCNCNLYWIQIFTFVWYLLSLQCYAHYCSSMKTGTCFVVILHVDMLTDLGIWRELQFFTVVNTQKAKIRHNLHNLHFMYQSLDPIWHYFTLPYLH